MPKVYYHNHGWRHILLMSVPTLTADSVAQTSQASKKMLYRASHPIAVLPFRDNHQAAVTVLPGDILEVIHPAQDDRFVVVSIKGEEFLSPPIRSNDERRAFPLEVSLKAHRKTEDTVSADPVIVAGNGEREASQNQWHSETCFALEDDPCITRHSN
jgi:hypothetical protein